MLIVADTRERANAHILKYFDRNGIPYRVAKVETGDYVDEERPGIAVERKRNLGELAINLCGPDARRFYAEVRRAHDAGIRLVVLCEHGGEIRTFRDVAKWRSPYGRVTGRMLQDRIFQLEMAYAVPVL